MMPNSHPLRLLRQTAVLIGLATSLTWAVTSCATRNGYSRESRPLSPGSPVQAEVQKTSFLTVADHSVGAQAGGTADAPRAASAIAPGQSAPQSSESASLYSNQAAGPDKKKQLKPKKDANLLKRREVDLEDRGIGRTKVKQDPPPPPSNS